MKTLKYIIIEMVPVILGVLIALFINDWREQSENEQFLDRVYSSIRQEMELNKKEFTLALEKHHNLLDTLKVYEDNDQVSLSEILKKGNWLQIPIVRNTSWKSFLNTKIELVDFEVISQLTDIEETKTFMESKSKGLMDFVLTNINTTSPTRKKLFHLQLVNLMDSESQLLEMYNMYLELGK